MRAFYSANDAGQLATSLSLLTDDATLATWSEGINGHHMIEKHLAGKAQIRLALGNLGLRRGTGQPDAPVYHETEFHVSGNQVDFMLRPDRVRPNGGPYSPYRIELVFDGCKIKGLTVVELITWL